ncbi:DUF899 domain-containing protein [Pseudomonas sp. UL073]|uniref:DUF899 domain-containing protein n=1 Tax=Zestomonas insulae TaxID=2809017 RepID=A0ABS2IKL1_9GAMM|nr:DUF899 domain-containing protein [Pseudomonas insulae]MBM7063285.1 DUF899 domain-containing protein [Pseudomonas insulae]
MNRPDLPPVVSRAEWLRARTALLAEEKALTAARDRLNVQRRALPMVAIEQDYRFDGPHGEVPLLELFAGRRQLIVYHFMFHRDRGEGCPGCSFVVDNIGHLAHLHARDTSLVLVSRAPLAELQAFQRRMGWTLPWYSSFASPFNYDFHVTLDAAVAPVQYNYRDAAELQRLGLDYHLAGEQPGVSVFLRDGAQVFHSYSSYGRGLDLLLGTYNYLDLTPFGRGEGWDGMPDLHGAGMNWTRLHDQYGAPVEHDCCAASPTSA